MAAFRLLGCSPTPMAWGEVYTALGQGVVDGQENPLSLISVNKLYEVQKYLAMTNHVYSPALVMFSKSMFDKLDPEIQQILIDTAKEVAPFQRSVVEDMCEQALVQAKANGMTVTYPDVSEFKATIRPVYEQYINDNMKEIFNKIQAAAAAIQ